jgi:hypothetical protein
LAGNEVAVGESRYLGKRIGLDSVKYSSGEFYGTPVPVAGGLGKDDRNGHETQGGIKEKGV